MRIAKPFFLFLTLLMVGLLTVFACSEDDSDKDSKSDAAAYLDVENINQGDCSQITESFFEYVEDGYNELFTFDWNPDGTLSITHERTCYNCGFEAFPIYQIEEDAIRIIEQSQEDFMPADCDCNRDITYDLVDVPPGVYDVYLSVQYEGEDAEILLQDSVYLPDDKEESYSFAEHHSGECI